MSRRKELRDGQSKFLTGRTYRHGGQRRRRGAVQADWITQTEAQNVEAQLRADAAREHAFKAAQLDVETSAAGNQSVDDLHPRNAR